MKLKKTDNPPKIAIVGFILATLLKTLINKANSSEKILALKVLENKCITIAKIYQVKVSRKTYENSKQSTIDILTAISTGNKINNIVNIYEVLQVFCLAIPKAIFEKHFDLKLSFVLNMKHEHTNEKEISDILIKVGKLLTKELSEIYDKEWTWNEYNMEYGVGLKEKENKPIIKPSPLCITKNQECQAKKYKVSKARRAKIFKKIQEFRENKNKKD